MERAIVGAAQPLPANLVGGGTHPRDARLRLLAELRSRGYSARLQALVAQLRPAATGPGRLRLVAPLPFLRDWLEENYGATLRELLASAAGGPCELELLAELPQAESSGFVSRTSWSSRPPPGRS